jgi:hypothetical protein
MVTIYTTRFNNSNLCNLATERIYSVRMILRINSHCSLNSINRSIFVTETQLVFFESGSELLNIS